MIEISVDCVFTELNMKTSHDRVLEHPDSFWLRRVVKFCSANFVTTNNRKLSESLRKEWQNQEDSKHGMERQNFRAIDENMFHRSPKCVYLFILAGHKIKKTSVFLYTINKLTNTKWYSNRYLGVKALADDVKKLGYNL